MMSVKERVGKMIKVFEGLSVKLCQCEILSFSIGDLESKQILVQIILIVCP